MSTATLDLPLTSTATEPTALDAAIARHQYELRTQGWTIFPRLMTDEQLTAIRKAIDAHIDRESTVRHEQNYHGVNLAAWDPAFGEVATNPLLLGTVEGLIGLDCILSSCNLGARLPGCAAQGLHRDTGIWGPAMPFMTFPVGIQTAWCVDEFTFENGATTLVPGSHADPTIPIDAPAIQAVAPAGSVIAFDCQAFHAGGANRSDKLRRAVLTLYIRSWLKPQTDHKRCFPQARWASSSADLLRLMGFRRQSPVEHADGRSEIIEAPGATAFYDQAVAAPARY
jgi:ectoine hydroxylase-related dioxygenase (phytanoyl-CoA dioxygenase family)